MSSTNPTTATVAVHLPVHLAEHLLHERGWRVVAMPRGAQYVRPGRPSREEGGRFGPDFLWALDEAVREALAIAPAGADR